MLELLFNVLLQLAILTGSASGKETKASGEAAKLTTQAAAPTTPPTKIGSTGWDDKD